MMRLDIVGYNTTSSACQRGKQWKTALALLQEIVDNLLSLTAVSYDAGISACEKGE